MADQSQAVDWSQFSPVDDAATAPVSAPPPATSPAQPAVDWSQFTPVDAAPAAPAPAPTPAMPDAAAAGLAAANAAIGDAHDHQSKVLQALRSLGRAAVMTGRDVTQGFLSLPAMVNDATLVPAINAISKAVGSDYREAPSSQQLDSYMNAIGIPDPQPQNATERVLGGVARGVGGLLSGAGAGRAMMGLGNEALQGVGNALASNLGAQTAATGMGIGASETARENGIGPTGQLALGLLGGGAPALYGAGKQAVGSGLGRLLSDPSPQAAELANQALDAGIPLKTSQVSPSKVAKLVDSVSGQVPFSGAQAFQDTQQQAFNRAVGRTIGVDASHITADVFAKARRAISDEFQRLTANNHLALTPELVGKLRAVASDTAATYGDDVQRPINTYIDRLLNQSQNGIVPGRVYQSVDSAIGKRMRAGGEASIPLGDLREALRDAMDQSIKPKDQAAWARARQQWRDMKTIEPLVAKDNVEGNISPAQLLGRVAADNAGKAAMATGRRGDLGDLAAIGQRFLKQQIPDSGTAQRNFAGRALGSIGSLGGGVAAGSLFGPLGGLMAVGGTVGGARGIQSALQSEAALNAMLGRKPTADELGRLLMLSADPTAQQLIQR